MNQQNKIQWMSITLLLYFIMIKDKNLIIKKLIEYRKENDLKENVNKVEAYKLPAFNQISNI